MQKEHAAKSPTDLVEELVPAISALYVAVRRCDTARTNRGSLPRSQLAILGALVSNGPAKLGELSAHAHITGPTAFKIVESLEEKGLVTRVRADRDKRVTLVVATPRGTNAYRAEYAEQHAWMASILRRISSPNLEALDQAVPALLQLSTAISTYNNPKSNGDYRD